ncbi:MAG TPA: efflux transporter outer membrane subunit [Terriglobales bacterium]|nr:efflux transporter outer membrane subunit [Terriglobales bacterium]
MRRRDVGRQPSGVRRPLIAVGGLLLLLSGCAVGPRYSKPTTPTPPSYKEVPPDWKTAQPSDQIARGKWWEIFQDPQLNALEEQVNVSDENLKAADARFRQARALVRFNRAAYYPTLTAGASAAREHLSQNRPLVSASTPTNVTDIAIPFDVSYEADVFGRVRHTVEAARSNAQASAADLETVRLSLHAELAFDYFEMRTLDAEEQLLLSNVTSFERALDLTQSRYKGGVASAVDVAQAQTQLENTRTQAIDVLIQRSQNEHAIATLIGQPASTFTVPGAAWNSPPPAVPPGLPSELLERRPDIAAAERRVAVANAQVGVARAAYFPIFTLTGSGGFESTAITTLIQGPSGFLTAGTSAAVTTFDAGRRRAVSEQARAAYDESVANYRQTVLNAFQEVEDSLAALRILDDEARAQQAAVAAAEHSLELSTNRYKGGVVSYLEVTTAQSTALADERAAVDILRRRMTATVSLIKALGGGWSSASLPSVKLDSRPPTATGQ